MRIILKRSFPWFPVVLAAGWILMMSLAVRDLAWFAAASASLDGRSTVASAPKAVSPARVRMPIGVTPCAAAAFAPAARIVR
jgi:hypothetical protein